MRPRVVRPGPRLGMELHRARAQLREGEPLDGAVVERDVRRLGRLGGVDAKPWFCARDEHAARRALEHRMVRAAVAERQLERRRGRSRGASSWWPRQMPSTGTRPSSSRTVAISSRERLRVAGAVREQHAVVAGELVGVDVVRVDGDRRARAREPAQDRALARRSRRPRRARRPSR